jgi:hypothetical protein
MTTIPSRLYWYRGNCIFARQVYLEVGWIAHAKLPLGRVASDHTIMM